MKRAAKERKTCQYIGCTEEATEIAMGGDQYGGEHAYEVCLKHAAEMEPHVFREKWLDAQKFKDKG